MAKNAKANALTIPAGSDTTPGLTLEFGRVPVALEMPATFTGTSLTFLAASSENGTPLPLYFESTLYTVTVGPSRHVALNRVAMEGVKFFSIKSSVTEGSARTINVISGE